MKIFKILFLSLLLCTSTIVGARGIERKPLQAPEDSSIAIHNEDRMTALEREIQALLGRVEVLEHNLAQLRSTNAITDSTANDHKSTDKAHESSEAEAEESPPLTGAKQSAEVAPETTRISASGSSEKKAYDSALLALKDNKYEEAETKFADFIAKYTKSNMLSNAYFWYGETFFRRNNFEKAAISYLKGYKQFPKAAKAADSLLKLSLSLGSMGKTKEACGMLNKLESEFKDRPANSIKRAKDARNKYGCNK